MRVRWIRVWWILFGQVGVQVGGVAQLGEHLLCKQGVTGSIPVVSTILPVCLSPVRAAVMRPASFVVQSAVVCLQTMTAAPIWLNPLGRPSGLNLGAQTWEPKPGDRNWRQA